MKLPTPPSEFERQVFRILESEDKRNVKAGQAQDFILLKAPNGTVYRVTVNNAGALVAVAV